MIREAHVREHHLPKLVQCVEHLNVAADADHPATFAAATDNKHWRVLAAALTATKSCAVVLRDGSRVLVRFNVAETIVLPYSVVGWVEARNLELTVAGAGALAGVLVVVPVKATFHEAAPAAPEQPELPIAEIEAELERVGYAASVDPRRLDDQGKRAHLRQRRRDLAEEQARAARRESADAWVREHHPGRLERAP